MHFLAARGHHDSRAGTCTNGRPYRRALAPAGDGANRRAGAGADSDLGRILLLRGLSLPRDPGRVNLMRLVSDMQAIEPERHGRKSLDPARLFGLKNRPGGLGASLYDGHAVYDNGFG